MKLDDEQKDKLVAFGTKVLFAAAIAIPTTIVAKTMTNLVNEHAIQPMTEAAVEFYHSMKK